MAIVIVLPAMLDAQEQGWHGLLDISQTVTGGWTLIGGQLVHLHCAERGITPNRPTNDVDTVLDIRAHPRMLETFTTALLRLGFRSAGASPDGHQHRWTREQAQIDVLIPRGVGPRAAARQGATGGTTVETPGGQQSLERTEWVAVQLGGRTGQLPRPNLLGALIVKAAATTVASVAKDRHLDDCAVLLSIAGRKDFAFDTITTRERNRLISLAFKLHDYTALSTIDGAPDGLDRLTQALGIDTSAR